MTFEFSEYPISTGLPDRMPGQYGLAMASAQEKIQLVTEQCPAEAACDHSFQGQVTLMGKKPPQQHDCFTFQEGSDYKYRISIAC